MSLMEGPIPITGDEKLILDTWPEGKVLGYTRRDPDNQGPLIVTSDTGEWLLENGVVTPLG